MDFRIFVAPCDNATAGRWLDPLDPDYDEAVAEISEDGQIEIFAPDHEGFEGFRSDSVWDLEMFAQRASAASEPEAFVAYVLCTGYSPEEASNHFDEAFAGEWGSEEAFAEQLADDTMEIPQRLQAYFDCAKFARDLFLGDYFSIDTSGGVYVFRHV